MRGRLMVMACFLGWFFGFLYSSGAGELPSPTPLKPELENVQLYFQKIYDNWQRLVVVTVNPNAAPARRGQRGEIIYATFGGTNRLCAQTTAGPGGGTTWQCVSLSTP